MLHVYERILIIIDLANSEDLAIQSFQAFSSWLYFQTNRTKITFSWTITKSICTYLYSTIDQPFHNFCL